MFKAKVGETNEQHSRSPRGSTRRGASGRSVVLKQNTYAPSSKTDGTPLVAGSGRILSCWPARFLGRYGRVVILVRAPSVGGFDGDNHRRAGRDQHKTSTWPGAILRHPQVVQKPRHECDLITIVFLQRSEPRYTITNVE